MPRGRGGRGRGRGGRGISSTRGGGRFSKPAPPLLRKSARTTSNLSESNLSNFDDQAGVYAIWDSAARLLTIRGLTEEDFERWEHDEDAEIDSVINEDDISQENHIDDGDLDDEYLREPPPKAALSQYEELWISPPRRGFYAPPPVKVWRKRQNASSGDGEIDGDIYDEDDPLNGHESMENEDQDQDQVDEGNTFEQITALDVVSPPKRVPKDLRMEESMEAEAASEQEDPPEMIEEGELSENEFPPAFLERPPTPDEADCDDPADFIVRTRFAPMSEPQDFVKALTRHPIASRDTKVLYELALNTQRALKEWQDEYLKLDARTAPHSNPPKKAVTGSRHPIDHEIYEDMKEADLYGYIFDPKKGPGLQDPFAQRPGGSESIGGRELRQRRARELGEEPSDDEGTGTEVGKRKRKAVVRYDGEPRAMRGRKRAQDSEPPEVDIPPRKRGRPSAVDRAAQMHQNIRRLRDESTVASTISESESVSPGPPRRRGRPPGSKNLQPRSDAGIKKGPRKGRLAFSTERDALQTEDDLAPTPVNGGQVGASFASSTEHPSVEKRPKVKLPRGDITVPSGGTTTPATDVAQQGPLNKRKQRVKSEKRSQSMTEWWAARKAKQLEERKKAQAEAEQQRVAEQQQAERNNFHHRIWTNDAHSPLGQKAIRSGGPTIAPAPHPSTHSSPVTPQFIISGPQQKPGHERKRSSPLKHEHIRTLSRDMQEIIPPPPPAYPPPPKPIQQIQQPSVNPFGHQRAPITSLPGFRHSSNSSVPPPPPTQSYPPPPPQAPHMTAQGPPAPPTHPSWLQHPYPPPPPPAYQSPLQQPPYIPSPQSSSHPPPPPLPPFNYPPQHGPQLQPLQPAPPSMGQSSPQATTSRGPPEWSHQRDWSRVTGLDTRPQLGPPAPIYDSKQEESRRQDQRPSHTFVHSHSLNRAPEKTESRDQEQSKA